MKRTYFERLLLKWARAAWKVAMSVNFFAEAELKRIKNEFPEVLSYEETIDRVIGGASLSRFGDGELSILLSRSIRFQRHSNILLQKFAELLQYYSTNSDEKFLVAIAPVSVGESLPKKRNRPFYEWYWIRHWRFLKKFLNAPLYGNTEISRLEAFAAVPLEKMKMMWDQRDVVFIVPPNGRFQLDERVFGNIKSAVFVDVPPMNAVDEYDRIMADALKHDREKLYIIVAGPTATALAFDFHRTGRQAIDLGHFVNCYHEFLGENSSPESLPFRADHPNRPQA